MAKIRFGDVEENVTTREEWSLEKSRESLKDETIAVLGYGVQGPGQALNLKDNGFRVIVGQRKGAGTWEKALRDGWVEGENLFELEESGRTRHDHSVPPVRRGPDRAMGQGQETPYAGQVPLLLAWFRSDFQGPERCDST